MATLAPGGGEPPRDGKDKDDGLGLYSDTESEEELVDSDDSEYEDEKPVDVVAVMAYKGRKSKAGTKPKAKVPRSKAGTKSKVGVKPSTRHLPVKNDNSVSMAKYSKKNKAYHRQRNNARAAKERCDRQERRITKLEGQVEAQAERIREAWERRAHWLRLARAREAENKAMQAKIKEFFGEFFKNNNNNHGGDGSGSGSASA